MVRVQVESAYQQAGILNLAQCQACRIVDDTFLPVRPGGKRPPAALESGWEMHYFRGLVPDGTKLAEDHQRRLMVKPSDWVSK